MSPTPTNNVHLPARLADFASLPEALDYAARGDTGFNFYSARGELTAVLPYRELREQAISVARGLNKAQLKRGSRLLLIADTTPEFAVMFFACQYAGVIGVPVSLPTTLGGRDAYVEGLRRQLTGCGAIAAAAPSELNEYLRAAAAGLELWLVGTFTDFFELPRSTTDSKPFGPAEPCYLQYSSGSTRAPLGVDIPQRVLMSNSHAIANHGLVVQRGDRCTSWLPLYHDMGLVGFMLTPLMCQLSVDYLTTRDFARRPLMWLQLISRNSGTLSYSPTFGYDLCARRAGAGVQSDLNLRAWRAAGVGGDMVQPQVLTRFSQTFADSGFSETSFVPSYGMAETTLAISFAPLRTGVVVDYVDRKCMAETGIATPAADRDPSRIRGFVACGRPLPQHQLEVRSDTGKALPQRSVGRIFVRGPSVMAGYYNDPDATARVLDPQGWLDTGDLGYLLNGQIVITGRAKDLIIFGGRNIWPQDLEWAVEELPGLRRGDVAAFSVEGEENGEDVVLLVQCRTTDPEERASLVRAVQGVVQRTAAIECKVTLIEPHGLPQTSSGKLSRSRAKTNYLSGLYGSLALAESSPAPPSTSAG